MNNQEKNKDKFDFERFKSETIEKLRTGKAFLGEEGFMAPLIKEILEASLEAEMNNYLDMEKRKEGNRKNGKGYKKVKSSYGEFDLGTPRDRLGEFEPDLVKKGQTFLGGDLESRIISLYGYGMSVGDIRKHVAQMYGVEISSGMVSEITNKIIPLVKEWQNRPLEAVYAIVWLDAMHYKIREGDSVITKAVYNVIGVNMEGKKEVLAVYIGENEGAKFWLGVLTNLQNRGVKDILIACIDNLTGFAQAIESIFPQTEVQLCIVHQVRNSLKYVTSEDEKPVLKDLKKIYQAHDKTTAEDNLLAFEEQWGEKYPLVVASWNRNWDRLSQYFKYSYSIRKLIYTTNPIEGFHRQIRKVTKTKGAFPSDMALLKLMYLSIQEIEKKWQKPLPKWALTITQLKIFFGDRVIIDLI